MRFLTGLQYRAAAAAGIATQFAWGFLEILVYRAFYQADAAAFPMEFSAVVNYIWLQQALLALFVPWLMETEIFSAIVDGNVAYELCRPVHIYHMWFARLLAHRISSALLRCAPILFISLFLPAPYGLTLPTDPLTGILFLLTLILGTLITVSIGVVIYICCFFTISAQGIRIFYSAACELLAGQIVPLPFMPDVIRRVLEILPFASMQNVPLRVFSGDLCGHQLVWAIALQLFWLAVLMAAGWRFAVHAETRIVVQGG